MLPRSLLAFGLGMLCSWAALAASIAAELPVDRIAVRNLPAATPYRLYLNDAAFPHIIDGKLLIIDGASLKLEGMVGTAYVAHTALSPDRSEIYVATTYYARLNRGERFDQIDVYDALTLKLKTEIALPGKRALALAYKGLIRSSANGRFIFVQNATPASSVSIVDRSAGKFVTEVATPGCWAIYTPASVSDRFSSLCGDGTMLTVVLDDKGNVVGRKKSAAFFDPDDDALFVSGEKIGDRYYFASFKGHLQPVDIGGDVALAPPRWSLVPAADAKGRWRPGGYQLMAVHEQSGMLYVGMHRNGAEGSHKNPADEIWAYDLASGKRLARSPAAGTTTLAVTQGAAPRLLAFDGTKAMLNAFNATPQQGRLKRLGSGGPFGETPTLMDTQ
ncbi:MAG: amine dehydrogenase large subunit [Sulfuritalea sp.]|nr:amine dehydrogenase large subunit [Sulfuritalea sp.]